MKRYLLRALYVLGIVVFIMVILEVLFSVMGFRAINHSSGDTDMNEQYDACKLIVPDSILGWNLCPGRHETPGNDSIYVSNLRVRSLRQFDSIKAGKTVAIYGCSYAFGQNLKDKEVFSALLQKKFPSIRILNRSVPAYNNVQMLLKLQQDVKGTERPDVVILGWAYFHPFRNMCASTWKSTFSGEIPGYMGKMPYPSCQVKNGQLRYLSNTIEATFSSNKNWLQSHSSAFFGINYLINYMQEMNEYERYLDATKFVIRDFKETCKEKNIPFYILGMTENEQTDLFANWCKQEDIHFVGGKVNMEDKKYYQESDRNHPNISAHHQYFLQAAQIIVSEPVLH